MNRRIRRIAGLAIAAGCLVRCASPMRPSSLPASSSAPTAPAAAVDDTIVQAIAAASGTPSGLGTPTLPTGWTISESDGKLTLTAACSGGGSSSRTMNSLIDPIAGPGSSFTGDMTTTYTNCSSLNVILNGTERVVFTASRDWTLFPPKTVPISMARMGSLSFVFNGVEGRTTFDCTILFGSTPADIRTSGSTSWEYPFGRVITGVGCASAPTAP